MDDERMRAEGEAEAEVERARKLLMAASATEPAGTTGGQHAPTPGAGLGRYFEPDGVKSGVAHYRLRDSGYAVWTIIGALRAVDGDVHAVAQSYDIPEEQVHACIGLLLRHPLAVLGRIADEEDPEVVRTETG